MPHRTRPPRNTSTAALARPQFVEVRGRTGRLWCRIDPTTQTAEFRRSRGAPDGADLVEVVDLKPYLVKQEET